MAVTLTVIGLHQIGASIGMALEIHKEKITRTGHDPAPHLAQNLLKRRLLTASAQTCTMRSGMPRSWCLLFRLTRWRRP